MDFITKDEKTGEIIHTLQKTVDHKEFLSDILNNFKEVRVGVENGIKPFDYVYFKVAKKEVREIVRTNKSEVTYSIMYNSKVKPEMKDILYLHKVRMTLLDDNKKSL